MLISLMKEEEIPQVAALEQVCFSEPWTEQGLRESFARPEYLFVTATEDGQVVGYAGLYQVLDEGDITNIAVLPSAREKGIGTVLTRALIEAGEQRAIHAFTLEVRVGNAAAIHIYEKLGFVPAGVRKGFYEKLREGADVSTSQPSPQEVMEMWDEMLSSYEQILYIPLSSSLSGSCMTASALSQEPKYDNKVFVVDNGRVSTPLHRSILDAIDLVEDG